MASRDCAALTFKNSFRRMPELAEAAMQGINFEPPRLRRTRIEGSPGQGEIRPAYFFGSDLRFARNGKRRGPFSAVRSGRNYQSGACAGVVGGVDLRSSVWC